MGRPAGYASGSFIPDPMDHLMDLSHTLYAESLGFALVYTPRGTVSHFAREDEPKAGALCATAPRWPGTLLGSYSQNEIDKAERLPLCTECVERLDELKESETSLRVGEEQ